MGDFQFLHVDDDNKEQVRSGERSMKISYTSTGGWYGLAFMDPPDDWGEKVGGFNLMGAIKLTFWAKSSTETLSGTFGFGMIGNEKPYFDTAKKSEKFQLTREWKKYELEIKGIDMRCIKTGFIMYLGGIGNSYSFWIDDIQYE